MPFKPMKKRDYRDWISQYGWTLKKGATDYKLLNEWGQMAIRNIIITHPGGEVVAPSVKKTEQYIEARKQDGSL
jgi:hypothetical protein